MKDDRRDVADRRGQVSRKLRDLAGVLPILGAILFATPLVVVVTGGADSKLPDATFYIFAVWGGLIALAFILSLLLRNGDGPE